MAIKLDRDLIAEANEKVFKPAGVALAVKSDDSIYIITHKAGASRSSASEILFVDMLAWYQHTGPSTAELTIDQAVEEFLNAHNNTHSNSQP